MKNKIIAIECAVVIILAFVVIFVLCGKNLEESEDLVNNIENEVQEIDEELLKSKDSAIDTSNFEFEKETVITLSNNDISIDGSGASVKNIGNVNTVEIGSEGAYRITGSIDNGRILVNAKDSNVNLILDNANITCLSSSPIYVYKSNSTMITLVENSLNTLSDGEIYDFQDEYSSSADEEPNSCLYSKSDLILSGNGSITVNAKNNNAITSKDNLYIENVNITVNAKNHGINGKDSNVIKNSNIEITSGGDAIRSTNDTDTTLGFIRIENSAITIDAGEDAIQAETDLIIYGGSYDIAANEKGIKAVGNLLLDGAEMNIIAKDDAIHANENIKIASGNYTLKTEDDAIHADATLTIDGGNINILGSYEGIEGNNIVINDGNIEIVSSDDGINAGGGDTNSENMNGRNGNIDVENMKVKNTGNKNIMNENMVTGEEFRKEKNQKPSGDFLQASMPIKDMQVTNGENILMINGGNITVNAEGDGIDSNGKIIMSGGNVTVYGPTRSGNGALDYNSTFEISGGQLIAVGASGMSQAPSNTSSQTSIMANVQTQKENAKVVLKDAKGNEIISCNSPKAFSNIVISSSELVEDANYELYINGEKILDVTAGINSSFNGNRGFKGTR